MVFGSLLIFKICVKDFLLQYQNYVHEQHIQLLYFSEDNVDYSLTHFEFFFFCTWYSLFHYSYVTDIFVIVCFFFCFYRRLVMLKPEEE